MREELYERYWPMVDDIWAIKSKELATHNNPIPSDTVRYTGNGPTLYDVARIECRFVRKPAESKAGTERARKKPRREEATRSCKVKALHYHGIPGIPNHYQFENGNAVADN
jgi:hypothetical protein